MNRRIFVLGAALAAAVPQGAVAQDAAADYPARAVRMIVPFAPGGFPDVVGRIVASQLQAQFGQPFVVENMPGAGGIGASEFVARSEPDGYTLLVATETQWGITPNIYASIPYDVQKDFAPVTALASTPVYLAVRSDLGVNSLTEMIDLVKSKPGEFSYGTPGIASAHHFLMETLMHKTGMEMTHIPYKGGSQVAPALAGGEVQIAISAYTNIAPFLGDGSVKLLTVSTPERSEILPDIPTFAEAGVADVEFTGEMGILAPAGTPEAIVQKLNAALKIAIASAEATTQLTNGGYKPLGSTSAEFAEGIAADLASVAIAVEIAGIEKQ